MNTEALNALLEQASEKNLEVFCVVASAGTTSTGAFDPIDEIAEICQKNNLWLHVDGAHGASFLLSHKHRHLTQGIEKADSIVWDAHKMLFVPSTSTMLLYKNASHSYEVFSQEAPYLFDKKEAVTTEFDGALRTVECTKHANAYGIWGVWAMFGPELLGTLIDTCVENAQTLYEMLKESDDFETIHEPQCNILCFRYVPSSLGWLSQKEISSFQEELRSRIVKKGNFYLTSTKLDGESVLRVALMNPLIEKEHLSQLAQEIRQTGMRLSGL